MLISLIAPRLTANLLNFDNLVAGMSHRCFGFQQVTESATYRGVAFGSCNLLNFSVASRPQETRHIEYLPRDNDPDVSLGVMLGNFFHRVRFRAR